MDKEQLEVQVIAHAMVLRTLLNVWPDGGKIIDMAADMAETVLLDVALSDPSAEKIVAAIRRMTYVPPPVG